MSAASFYRYWSPRLDEELSRFSTQVLQALAVNLRRKARKPLDAKATRDVVTDYMTWPVVLNGTDSILDALEIEERIGSPFGMRSSSRLHNHPKLRSCIPKISQNISLPHNPLAVTLPRKSVTT